MRAPGADWTVYRLVLITSSSSSRSGSATMVIGTPLSPTRSSTCSELSKRPPGGISAARSSSANTWSPAPPVLRVDERAHPGDLHGFGLAGEHRQIGAREPESSAVRAFERAEEQRVHRL